MRSKVQVFSIMLVLLYYASCQGCTPLYPRVHYGEQFLVMDVITQDNLKAQKQCTNYAKDNVTIIIKFNTQVSCKKSYVSIIYRFQIDKFGCTQYQLKIGQETQFIQTCKVEVPKEGFQYRLTGTPTSYQGSIQNGNFDESNDITYTVQLATQLKFNFIVTSNWGLIKKKPYKSITASLQTIIKDGGKSYPAIHALLINGDFIDSFDSAQNYRQFMNQLSTVSPYCPLIVTPGSKQSLNSMNYEVFSKTFELNQVKYPHRIQAYNIGPAFLISYDPWLQYYNKATPRQSQTFSENIQKVLNRIKNQSKAKIVTNNYPLACSQNNQNCRNAIKYYPQILSLFDRSSIIDLYIGGHQPQYERIAPYINGRFHAELQAPYLRGKMVSVVQAVAGNDQYIVDQEYQRQPYSVVASYNRTGFGLVSVQNVSNSVKITYAHYFVQPSLSVFDNFTIQGNKAESIEYFNLKIQ